MIWSLFPPNLLAQALKLLGDATATSQDEGISWRRRAECPSTDSSCILTVVSAKYRWMLLDD